MQPVFFLSLVSRNGRSSFVLDLEARSDAFACVVISPQRKKTMEMVERKNWRFNWHSVAFWGVEHFSLSLTFCYFSPVFFKSILFPPA